MRETKYCKLVEHSQIIIPSVHRTLIKTTIKYFSHIYFKQGHKNHQFGARVWHVAMTGVVKWLWSTVLVSRACLTMSPVHKEGNNKW